MIDARVFDITNATKDIEGGTFTDNIWSLDRRRMYKPLLEGKEKK
jgi:3'-5' exoribonuclease